MHGIMKRALKKKTKSGRIDFAYLFIQNMLTKHELCLHLSRYPRRHDGNYLLIIIIIDYLINSLGLKWPELAVQIHFGIMCIITLFTRYYPHYG